MRSIVHLFFIMLLSVFLVPGVNAQKSSHVFEITSGSVKVTPAYCPQGECQVVRAKLKGGFTATLSDNNILFSDIQVTTLPQMGFTLPENPNSVENGTTKTIEFSFQDQKLKVSGAVDQRAFDGPLYDYKFTAKVTDPVGFNSKGFYYIRQDMRKCASPLCGGVFLKAVNQFGTRCVDGSWADECYVASVNWDALGVNPLADASGLNGDAGYIVQGQMESQNYENFGNLGVFIVNSAYRPVTKNSPKGLLVGLQDNGIACITSPCFSIQEYICNRDRQKKISGFDLNFVGADAETITAAHELFNTGDVLLVSGENQAIMEANGIGISFVADQFYLPITSKR